MLSVSPLPLPWHPLSLEFVSPPAPLCLSLGEGGGGGRLLHNVFVPLMVSLCQLEQAAHKLQLSGGVSVLHS